MSRGLGAGAGLEALIRRPGGPDGRRGSGAQANRLDEGITGSGGPW